MLTVKETQAALAFATDVWDSIKEGCNEGAFDIEIEGLLETAKKHGLTKYVLYDPEKHGSEIGAEYDMIAGEDSLWWWGESINIQPHEDRNR